jgi:hypothetical protein
VEAAEVEGLRGLGLSRLPSWLRASRVKGESWACYGCGKVWKSEEGQLGANGGSK